MHNFTWKLELVSNILWVIVGLKSFKFMCHKENRFLFYGPTRALLLKIINSYKCNKWVWSVFWPNCKFIIIYFTPHDNFTSLYLDFQTFYNFECWKTCTCISLWPLWQWPLDPALQIMIIFKVPCTFTSIINPNLRQYCIF